MMLHVSFDEAAMEQSEAANNPSATEDIAEELAAATGAKKEDVIRHLGAIMVWLPSVKEYWQSLTFDGHDVYFSCKDEAPGNAGWSGHVRVEKNNRVVWSYYYADNAKSYAKNRSVKRPVLDTRDQLTSRLLIEFNKFVVAASKPDLARWLALRLDYQMKEVAVVEKVRESA